MWIGNVTSAWCPHPAFCPLAPCHSLGCGAAVAARRDGQLCAERVRRLMAHAPEDVACESVADVEPGCGACRFNTTPGVRIARSVAVVARAREVCVDPALVRSHGGPPDGCQEMFEYLIRHGDDADTALLRAQRDGQCDWSLSVAPRPGATHCATLWATPSGVVRRRLLLRPGRVEERVIGVESGRTHARATG